MVMAFGCIAVDIHLFDLSGSGNWFACRYQRCVFIPNSPLWMALFLVCLSNQESSSRHYMLWLCIHNPHLWFC